MCCHHITASVKFHFVARALYGMPLDCWNSSLVSSGQDVTDGEMPSGGDVHQCEGYYTVRFGVRDTRVLHVKKSKCTITKVYYANMLL